LEFAMRRESYNWLVDELGLYRSKVHEFARLQLTFTILSKRKLITLVEQKHVAGWDDPRMSTVSGFRRRGFSPAGINAFCDDVGVTTRISVIPIEKLEQFVRLDLDKTSRRIFAIFDPIKVTIKGWDKGKINVTCPNVPNADQFGNHEIPFTGTCFFEKSDFKEVDEKDYYGMALNNPEKLVRIKYTNLNVKLVEIVKDESGKPVELIVEDCPGAAAKHAIHWVPIIEGEKSFMVEVREYERLFLSENPIEKYDKAWLKDLNPKSLTVVNAIIDPSVKDLKDLDRIQIERFGYYCVDRDSTPEKLVVNKTLALKESNYKKAGK